MEERGRKAGGLHEAPGPSARFLVPWRCDGGRRDRLWAFARLWWATACPDIPICEGASPPGPFSRAAALNDAARGDWEFGIVLDADVIAEPSQVYDALEGARATGRLTLAFERYMGLTPNMTERVLGGYRGDWSRGVRWRTERHESSIVVVPRALWEEVGGFDERFLGWGQEDVAFVQACRVLGGGIERVEGTVWHLWHPHSPDRDRRSGRYQLAQALGKRYRAARTPEAVRALLAERDGPMSTSERRVLFSGIYQRNGWNGRAGSRAGPGSTMEATEHLRAELPRIVSELGVASVLDAACGDSLWMPELPGYVGVDIVAWAVRRARIRHPERRYLVADICSDELPRAELVICRDAMQHMSLADGLAALERFRATGAQWLVASSHRGADNQDVPTGGWYEINLEAEPFALGEPKWTVADGTWGRVEPWPHKYLGLWCL